MDRCTLDNNRIRAVVKDDGAELCSLIDGHGREVLWQAGPAWPRHAPLLFPIVGRLKDDRLLHDGKTHHLVKHGFARDRRFVWVDRQPHSCRLALTDDAGTREHYPFPFRLEAAYELQGDALAIRYTLSNPGADSLPASLGAHPAFRWPLVDGVAKEAHTLEFEAEEGAGVRRLDGDLLDPAAFPTPVEGRHLRLDEALFDTDALIFDHPASRSVRYTAPGAPVIEVSWDGFEQLGLWSKRGGDFLCIEPWHGFASPAGFDGAFRDKPGLVHIPPGGQRTFAYRIAIE